MTDRDWSFILVEPGGDELEAVQTDNRSVVWRLDDAASASFEIDPDDDTAAAIAPFAADLLVQRNGADLYRGKLLDPGIELGTDDEGMNVETIDYRGLITAAAYTPPGGATFAGADQADIAWDLIAAYQARPGGARGITRGVGQVSGITRDRIYEQGAPIGELIADLGRVRNGFDWEIDADLAFNMWHTGRGRADIETLAYGAAVATAMRPAPTAPFGNAWHAYGGEGTAPSPAVALDVATDPRGRWEQADTFADITVQNTLDDRAAYLLDLGTGAQEWVIGLELGWWEGPDTLWIGDTFTLSIDRPNVQVEALYRVIELAVDLGDSDAAEAVTIGAVEVL